MRLKSFKILLVCINIFSSTAISTNKSLIIKEKIYKLQKLGRKSSIPTEDENADTILSLQQELLNDIIKLAGNNTLNQLIHQNFTELLVMETLFNNALADLYFYANKETNKKRKNNLLKKYTLAKNAFTKWGVGTGYFKGIDSNNELIPADRYHIDYMRHMIINPNSNFGPDNVLEAITFALEDKIINIDDIRDLMTQEKIDEFLSYLEAEKTRYEDPDQYAFLSKNQNHNKAKIKEIISDHKRIISNQEKAIKQFLYK